VALVTLLLLLLLLLLPPHGPCQCSDLSTQVTGPLVATTRWE
jgi:hypothetical protein